MSTTVGADVEALEALASQFDSGAEELRALAARLTGAIEATHDWQGPDAQRCKEEWSGFARDRMAGVGDALAAASRLLADNAREQERASAADGAGGGYGVLAVAQTGWTVGNAAKKVAGAFLKAKALVDFLRLARAKSLGQLMSSVTVAQALKTFMQGGKEGGLLGKIGLPALGRLAGKAFLPMTVLTGAWDAATGGGYDGLRGATTRVLGGAGALGAVALVAGGAAMVATAPITATVAASAVALYGAWSAGNYVVDNWSTLDRAVFSPAISAVGRAWEGATTGVSSALGWARGLLGGPRTAGAGA
ncbi:hypothetical protein [Nocardioides litoris]|uniref:hypothetical protein n=1 Tax=Nocardioides litoris TaxID=1926648 RepID=UPI00111F43F5|nr:hypothetical protein [Nocardioides litoris]